MFYDCWRCGWGGRYEGDGCPLCQSLDETQAEYIRGLHSRSVELYRLEKKQYDILSPYERQPLKK